MSREEQQLRTRTKKEAMILALEHTLGIVTPACRIVGISRQTHFNWMKSDTDYAERIQDVSDIVLDFTEAALMKNINSGKEASIFFHLKTKGKKRGYIERNDFGGREEEATTATKISDDAKSKIIDILEEEY